MEYIAIAWEGDGFVFDVGALYEVLSKLADKRNARGKRYPLALVLVVLAKLAGEDTPSGIADWARLRCGLLVAAFQRERRAMPGHNTYRRVLRRAVDVNELQAATSAFLLPVGGGGQRVQIVLDGKTLRGTIAAGENQGLHLLAAYLPTEGIVLIQVAVEPKENEIVAAPRLLAVLDLRGKIVCGDALLTQRELSVQILAAGGDYIWPVKENQPQLLADIQEVFEPLPTASGWGQAPRDLRTAQTLNSGHGRLEMRTLTASSFLNDYSDWPGLAQVFKLERQVTLLSTGEIRSETAYGITSLTAAEASPQCLLKLVRDYWSIENSLP